MTIRLNGKEQAALKKFKNILEKELADKLTEVKLFGSKARGDAHKDSDLDVLVIVSSGDWQMCDIVYGIVTDILLETEVCISPKVVSKKEYNRLCDIKASFIKNVVREGITI